jgi:hypothetical protein
LTSVDRGLALLLLFETPLLLPGFLFLRCGSFVWLVGMSSGNVWKRDCDCVFKNFKLFFLLKFNMVYMFWIVLMC